MIRTIISKQYWNIFQLFYANHNNPLHLRDISRKIKLKESATSRHLHALENNNILKSQKDANLRKYCLKKQAIPEIFSLFDDEKLGHLPLLRKNAIKEYLAALKNKPILMVIFGSTAKGNYTDNSDVDILEIFSNKTETTKAKSHAGSLTGLKIQSFQITEADFYKELKMKEDMVIQSALNTGFPVFNNKFFYELIYNG
ncbi:nucleotidyltransferase domain-containing protein [Candidatus Woesearchaeota archaeon]|nr:nucleotidyltransferase domain-containing protein [Candidatus Woesearchaeota archaeon]